MRRLIKADINRIVLRPWPWILLFASYIFFGIDVFLGLDSPDLTYHFLNKVSSQSLPALIIGFTLLISIYGDEFKSMVMVGVIGRGLDRDKFVLAKFLDLLILGAAMFALTGVMNYITALIIGVGFNAVQLKFFLLSYIIGFLEAICYVTIAEVFFFLTENVALGVFSYLAFELIIPIALVFLSQLPAVARYHLDSYYISGTLYAAYSDFIMGDVLGGLGLSIATIIVYVGIPLFLTILIFRKKELNF